MDMTGHRTDRLQGFTILELMIVVSIIAVLTTMLLPALGRAKEIARNAVCKVNIRHMALANHLYAEENNEFFVLAAEDITSVNRKRWHGVRETSNEPFNAYKGPMRKYLTDGGIKECPSFTDFLDDPDEGAFEAGCGGYGYNQYSVGGSYNRGYDPYAPPGLGVDPNARGARIDDVFAPSQTVMFTDAAQLRMDMGGVMIAYSFCEPPEKPGSPTPNPSIHFRHLGERCNVSWVDTHVSQEELTFSAPYLTYGRPTEQEVRSYGLGWFGPRSNELFDLE